jgi:alpha-glucosidase
VHIYRGTVPNSFVYYEDDGETYNHEKGSFFKRNISYNEQSKSIQFGKAEGSFKSKFNNIKLVMHGFSDLSSLSVDGRSLKLLNDFVSFLTPISKFDPQGTANNTEGINVKSVVFKNNKEAISISY